MDNGDTVTVLPGEPPLMVHWRRSRRARRLSLRVSGLDGRITLTLPYRARQRDGEDFLAERTAWLRAAVSSLPETRFLAAGDRFPFEGQLVTLVPAAVRGPRLEDRALLVPQRGAPASQALAWLKMRARDRIAEQVDRQGEILGHSPRSLRFRDTRSRWGSCSSAGDLMFSWRLIMAPPRVLDYVVAHELAHLVQMDHSPAFWAVVARLMPDHAAQRRWLRREGATLHRYRFVA